MKQAITLTWALVLFASGIATPATLSAETVVVRLQSDRQLSATIHPRSNDSRLWLQYGTRAVTVIRPVDWQTIVWASHNGEQISIPQLKELASGVASSATPPTAPSRVLRVPPADQRTQTETMAIRARKALAFSQPVRSVQFDAVLANWDGDVETDGLLLRVFPIDDQGTVAAASGTLHVEFVARRRRDFNDVPRQRGSTVGNIGRWTVQVDEADFRQGAATVKLPFQSIHPEFDTDWFADGLVHVRFVVAGDGTFERSLDGIRTRPFSPFRDALQLQSGRRFLPSEQTGLGPRSEG